MEELRVVHYPRVSSKEQADKGDSIEAQERRLDEHSTANKHKCVGIYTDAGKSASLTKDDLKINYKDGVFHIMMDIRKRFGMMKICDEAQKDLWDAIKITKWDRYSRNNLFSLITNQYFKQNNKFILATDDSNDPLVKEISGVLSQEEVRKLTGRVRETRKFRFQNGMIVSKAPFGYKPIIKLEKVVGFALHTTKSLIVKECFERTNKGEDYKTICEQVGLKPQQYYNIIKNKVYCGYVTFEEQEKKGVHQPIITEELWHEVQRRMKEKKKD